MKIEKKSNLDRYIFLWSLSGFILFYTLFFSPILFSDNIFLSDGQWSAFYSELTFWSDDWAGGWPAAADLTQFMFNPLRHIFRFFSGGFNFFIISSYVLISTFMFGFMYDLTRSKFAAVISGLILGLSGFMMAHLGHTAMINGAAWTPLLLWSLSRIRQNLSSLWLLLGSCSISLMFISGHPQITVYSCLLGGIYAIFLGTVPRILGWRYWITIFSIFGLGFGIAAFQWLPTYELISETFRSEMPYAEFVWYSLPLRQVPMLIFPHLFGYWYYNGSYVGAISTTELSGYAGTMGLALSIIALVIRRDRTVVFWLVIALISVLLALGGSLPWLAKLVFNVPVLNGFRASCRFVYVYAIAVSILAGLGLAALERSKLERKTMLSIVVRLGVFFLISIILALWTYINFPFDKYVENLAASSMPSFSIAVALPMMWMISFISIIFFKSRGIEKNYRILIVFLVALDMATFGWFHEWRFGNPSITANISPLLYSYHQKAMQFQQKILGDSRKSLSADRARVEGIQSLNWYGPLMLKRFSEVTGIGPGGNLDLSKIEENSTGVELFGGRYLVTSFKKEITTVNGSSWLKNNLNLQLGECGKGRFDLKVFKLPMPIKADQLNIVSVLGCSVHIHNGQQVIDIELSGAYEESTKLELRAGEETAEWAIDRYDVAPNVRHRKATVFSSQEVHQMGIPSYQAHSYVATLRFPRQFVTAISLKTRADATGIAARIENITLVDGLTGAQYVVDPIESVLASSGWNFLETMGDISVYENNRARPPAWLIHNVVLLRSDEVLRAIHTSLLPDGQHFSPASQAIVEKETASLNSRYIGKSEVQVIQHEDTYWKMITHSDEPVLLVVRQNYYPGWRASLDGNFVDIERVNYTQQGVYVPAGEHIIELGFYPYSFYLGCLISFICLVILIFLFRYQARLEANLA
jgi:hypothetical protein